MTNTSQPPKDKVETTFELLASAKKLESESSYWLATEKFVQAHNLLRILAEEESKKASVAAATAAAESGDDIGDTPSAKEIENIATLYASKADEYWKQSRRCLIQAMEQEKSRDDEQKEEDVGIDAEMEMEAEGNKVPSIQSRHSICACTLLDDDQARARNRSFSVLFSRPVATVEDAAEEQRPSAQPLETPEEDLEQPENEDGNDNDGDGENTADDNKVDNAIADEVDLEARLRSLNQSLPSGFKTVEERMSDVNSGLGSLGVSSVYTQPNSAQRMFDDELPKSEDEQIDEILAQAQDEAMMDNMNRGGGDDAIGQKSAAAAARNNDDDSSFGDDDDDDDSESGEEDLLLDNDQLGMKTIHKKVVKAQVKLAELLALVDQARSKRAKEDQAEEDEIYKDNRDNDDGRDNDSDEDSFREVQKHDVAFLMMTSKKKLKSAQRDLKKALVEWDDLIL
jgi:hypothetical protein